MTSEKTIPPYITNEGHRKALAEIAQHLKTLEHHHALLIQKVLAGTLDQEDADLLKQINAAHGNLEKQWQALAPSLADAIAQLGK